MPYTYCFAGGQIIGSRANQEDSFRLYPNVEDETEIDFGYAVLADGMGGAQDGERASSVVAESAIRSLLREPLSLFGVAEQANDDIRLAKQLGEMDADAGSTMIALRFAKGSMEWASVGDSLLYLYRQGILQPLNQKHVLGLLLDQRAERGEISWEEAQNDADRQALYCAVCGDEMEAVDAPPAFHLQHRDRIIIASDGLLTLGTEGITDLLSSHESCSPAHTVSALLKEVQRINRPRQDNTTVIVLDCLYKTEEAAPDRRFEKTPPRRTRYEVVSESLLGGRSEQQDRIFHAQNTKAAFAVIIDGAGGSLGGALAAQIAADSAKSLWQNTLAKAPSCAIAGSILSDYLIDTHLKIVRGARVDGAPINGQAAIAALYLCNNEACLANVGDCRVYMLENRHWEQLSTDDSVLAKQVAAGLLTEEEAWQHPDQNILLQALGGRETPKPHVTTRAISEKSAFLLCCDGLWSQLHPDKWQHSPVFSVCKKTDSILKKWVRQAVDNTEKNSDNVSAVLLVPHLSLSTGLFCNPKALTHRPLTAILLTAVLLAAAFALLAIGGAYLSGAKDGTTFQSVSSWIEKRFTHQETKAAKRPEQKKRRSHRKEKPPVQKNGNSLPDTPTNDTPIEEVTTHPEHPGKAVDLTPIPAANAPRHLNHPPVNGSENESHAMMPQTVRQEPSTCADEPHTPVQPAPENAVQQAESESPTISQERQVKPKRKDKNHSEQMPTSARECLQQAVKYLEEQNTKQAIPLLLLAAWRSDPGDEEVRIKAHSLLESCFLNGTMKEEHLRETPRNSEALYWVACFRIEQETEDAYLMLRAATNVNKHCPWAEFAWGTYLLNSADTEEEREEGRRHISLAEDFGIHDYDSAMQRALKKRKDAQKATRRQP